MIGHSLGRMESRIKKLAPHCHCRPHAKSRLALGGNYFEDICPFGDLCIPSMKEAVTELNQGGTVTAVPACSDTGCNTPDIGAAIAAAKHADTIILALGTSFLKFRYSLFHYHIYVYMG